MCNLHDSSACLVKDGEVVAAVEEERLTRKKHDGTFPVNSINYCLRHEGITWEEIDHIAFSSPSPHKAIIHHYKYLINGSFFRKPAYVFNSLKYYTKYLLRKGIKSYVKKETDTVPPIHYLDHHLAHAASAYRLSGFDTALIFTADTRGVTTSVNLGMGDKGNIDIFKSFHYFDSLGLFYGAFTEYLGFKMGDGEGKVMGLAAYGKPVYPLTDIISIGNGNFNLNLGYFYEFSYTKLKASHYGKKIVREFGNPRGQSAEITQKHRDIAASVQKKLNDACLELVKSAFDHYGSRNLCIAGGVGLNMTTNSYLLNSPFVDEIFIQPAAGDGGTSMGAALELCHELGEKSPSKLKHAYLGPEYDNETIKKILDQMNLRYEIYEDIAGICSELLATGKIIGWFQGRMEFGPRALGNRSILANPSIPGMKDKVNNQVKHREPWRPFAPSILAEKAGVYLEKEYPSPFMLLSFNVIKEKQDDLQAAMHVDGTVRPQTVEKNINPIYWKLIKSFENETSIPAILNTSFNIQGEPIVCSPQDAINCFLNTGLDALAIGNFLVGKKDYCD
jgi:carbamoyltransferase